MSGWPSSPLGQVADIERYMVQPGDIQPGALYVGLEHIVSGGEIADIKPVANGELKSTKFRFFPDHILYGKLRPYLAKIAAPDFEGVCSTEIVPIRPGPRLDRGFLLHFLRQPSQVELATSRSAGANLPRLSPTELAGFVVPLPPLAEQRRIAAILDQADALRAKRRAALAQLEEMAQAIFVEMFGTSSVSHQRWKIVNLGDVASFYSGNSLPEGEAFSNQENGHLLLKVSDLNMSGNERVVARSAGWTPSKGSKASTCPTPAVVFPKRGGAIGTNKKRVLTRSAILDPNLMGVVPNGDEIDCEYLFGWFNTFDLTSIVSGSSVPQLNKQDLAPLQIPVPPIDLQRRYRERIAVLSSIRDAMKDQKVRLDNLFSNVQHRAFTGAL